MAGKTKQRQPWIAESWNAAHPVGTRVRYWPVLPPIASVPPLELDDNDPLQRFVGIEAGLAWGDTSDTVVVYEDLGVSPGMRLGIEAAMKRGASIFFRKLDPAGLAAVMEGKS